MSKTTVFETKSFRGKTSIEMESHVIHYHHPIHQHSYYELEYVRRGTGNVVINNISTPFTTGALWFCDTTDFHEIHVNGEAEIINICFKADIIDSEILTDLAYGTVISFYDKPLIETIFAEYRNQLPKSERYIKKLINCVLIDILRTYREKEDHHFFRMFSPPIRLALHYIQGHFSDDISLDDVAAISGFSPNHFSTCFHNEVKQPFKSYLINMRLETSAKFLASTENSVVEICYLSGFNDYANFSRAFKKKYGMSPAQYRSQNKSE